MARKFVRAPLRRRRRSASYARAKVLHAAVGCGKVRPALMAKDTQTAPFLFVKEGELPELQNRDEVVSLMTRELSGMMGLQDAETAVAAALEREHLEPTFVSQGLAVPHGRIPGLARAGVYAARSAKGVNWDLGQAQFIILLLVPEERPEVHLGLLRNLMRWRFRLGENAPAMLAAPVADYLQSLQEAVL